MVEIALSSGWLFAHGRSTRPEQNPFFELVDGAELSVTREERFNTYSEPLEPDAYTSFHLSPDPSHIDRLASLCETHDPEAAVLHPDAATEALLAEYAARGVPLSIENMDVQKDSGFAVDELAVLINQYSASFTLDVQHAYEHDASMDYAWELVEMAGEKLAELHVSGETTSNRHALVHEAENREAVLSFLESFYDTGRETPMVIEGEYRSLEAVEQEVSLLRSLA